ncbi:MAG: DUF5666 domain-containing protein, partial [Burkholderiales bacterium]
KTLTILGITVKYDAATLLKDSSGEEFNPSTLSPGDNIKTEGFVNSDNSVAATRIERKDNSITNVSLLGPIDADLASPNFTIVGVQVTTNVLTLFNNDAAGSAAFFNDTKKGQLVKVKGSEASNVISATEVENED